MKTEVLFNGQLNIDRLSSALSIILSQQTGTKITVNVQRGSQDEEIHPKDRNRNLAYC